MSVRVYSNLKMGDNSRFKLPNDIANSDFPITPEFGEVYFAGGILFTYTKIEGIATWYPLNNKAEHYTQTISSPSTTWTILHNFDTKNIVFFAYDSNDDLLIADVDFPDSNTLQLNFTEEVAGRIVVFASSDTLAKVVNGGSSSFDPTPLQTEIDRTQLGAGLNENGLYSADLTTYYISGASSLKNADKLLDAKIKVLSDSLSNIKSSRTVVTKTSDYNMTSDDSVVLVDASSNNINIKLADPALNTNNIDIKRIDTNTTYTVTIIPFNSELIENVSSYNIDVNYGFTLISNGINWYMI